MSQTLAFVVAGAILFAAIFSLAVGMKTDAFGNMSDCQFKAENSSICSMGIMEHIGKWLQLSAAVFFKTYGTALMILLLLAYTLFAVYVRTPKISHPVIAPPTPVPESPETKIFNYLVIVFSQGILNPRLYA